MNKQFLFSAIAALAAVFVTSAAERRLPLATYRDKMKAAWIGQIAGVAMGAPTEFKYNHKIMPADQWKPWRPEMINNAFDQDDVYVEIACRGGFDSDCNPSSAAGVVFTAVGYSKLPERFTSKIDVTRKFEFTDYTIPGLLSVCEGSARQVVVAEGGRIENDPVLGETFVIPVKRPTPSPLEDYKNPKPLANAKFTPEEMAKILFAPCAWGHQSPKKP